MCPVQHVANLGLTVCGDNGCDIGKPQRKKKHARCMPHHFMAGWKPILHLTSHGTRWRDLAYAAGPDLEKASMGVHVGRALVNEVGRKRLDAA